MYRICFTEIIPAPASKVWDVITRLEDYPAWNPFVIACESTLRPGDPILMTVRLMPGLKPMRQKETVRANTTERFLEYGVHIPFGILTSSRQHHLKVIDANTTEYRSDFIMGGLLAPVVRVLFGKHLHNGFAGMTAGIVRRASKQP